MNRDLIKLILNHLWEHFILIFTIIIPIWVAWYPGKFDKLDSKIYLTFIIIILVTLAVSIKFNYTIYKHFSKQNNRLPKLINIKGEYYIFEPCDFFSSQSIVTFHFKGDTEQCIGIGDLETVISDSKKLQVRLKTIINKSFDKRFIEKNKGKIVLKPSVPNTLLAFFSQIQEEASNG